LGKAIQKLGTGYLKRRQTCPETVTYPVGETTEDVVEAFDVVLLVAVVFDVVEGLVLVVEVFDEIVVVCTVVVEVVFVEDVVALLLEVVLVVVEELGRHWE
jgi:hypothetical protein